MTRTMPMIPMLSAISIGAMADAPEVHAGDVIDFETIPSGETPAEGLEIGDQYLATHGIRFRLEDGSLPVLAQVGTPTTAFAPNDSPADGSNIGEFFLTDDGELSGLDAVPLIVEYDTPTAAASGVVLDIDFDEQFTIEARDVDDLVVETVVISAGDPNTGDRQATPWSFERDDVDIYSIRFEGTRNAPGFFGLGFDRFAAFSVVPIERVSWAETKQRFR